MRSLYDSSAFGVAVNGWGEVAATFRGFVSDMEFYGKNFPEEALRCQLDIAFTLEELLEIPDRNGEFHGVFDQAFGATTIGATTGGHGITGSGTAVPPVACLMPLLTASRKML